MTDKEILQKAIEKAEGNGFDLIKYTGVKIENVSKELIAGAFIRNKEHYNLIFSHDFAKAFWGNEAMEIKYYTETGNANTNRLLDFHTRKTCILKWAYHLQQMVLEKEPLKYIEKFL